MPFAGALSLLGTVPMGLLAYRYRLRVLIAATVAAGLIAFLIAGLGGLMTVVNSAYVGGLTGIVKRRGRGTRTVIVVSFVAGAVFGAVTVAALAVLARLRHLIFDAITANIDGVAAVLTRDRALRDRAPVPAEHPHRDWIRGDRARAAVAPRRGAALLAVAAASPTASSRSWACR